MPIDIQEDFDQPDGGYAILTLPQSIGDDDGSLRIRRLAGEPDKLGPKGWQPHDAVIKPASLREVGGKTALYFGPELTQHLMEETEVEISVIALGTTQRVVWPYITPSVNADGSRGAVAGAVPKAEAPTIQTDPVTHSGQDEPPIGPGGDTTIIDPPFGDPPKEDDKGFNWLWLIPIVAVSAFIVFYFLPLEPETIAETEEDTPTSEVAETTDDIEVPETTEIGETTQEAVEPAAVDTRESLMAEAVACRNEGCEGDAYFDIANRLDAIGVTDLFAIMGLAADNGSVPAMEWLARSFDPLHFQENEGLSNPDLGSAFLYYAQAEDAGSDQASPAKVALCAALAAPADAEWNATPTEDEIRAALEGNCQ